MDRGGLDGHLQHHLGCSILIGLVSGLVLGLKLLGYCVDDHWLMGFLSRLLIDVLELFGLQGKFCIFLRDHRVKRLFKFNGVMLILNVHECHFLLNLSVRLFLNASQDILLYLETSNCFHTVRLFFFLFRFILLVIYCYLWLRLTCYYHWFIKLGSQLNRCLNFWLLLLIGADVHLWLLSPNMIFIL